jgi:uncharacterized repeat protein (TIGR01451 family)
MAQRQIAERFASAFNVSILPKTNEWGMYMALRKHTLLPAKSQMGAPSFARAVSLVLSVLALVAGLDGSQPALARSSAGYNLVNTYPDPSPATNEEFGNAVALLPSGNQLVVAARSDRVDGANAVGAVYVLTTTTGLISRTITDTAGEVGDYFGYSIAVSGTTVLVGDQLKNSGVISHTGSAFLFDTGTGALLQTFTETVPTAQDKFGSAVAIVSDTAVLVGVPYYSTGDQDVGRAYICLLADGTCPTAIDSPSATAGGFFGLSVAALGNYFAIAAPFDGTHGTVYVYTTTTGLLYKTITLTGPTTGDYFGSSMSNVNGNLLIGAQNGGTGVINTPGAAYLYSPSGVLLRAFHNPNATESGALFGAAVAGDGNIVLIGAPIASAGQGRAYVFNATTGALMDTLQKQSPVAGDHFGNAVDMLGETFVVGAPGDSQGASGAGAVYRFGPAPASFATSSKSVNTTTVKAGGVFTYTLNLVNSGTISAGFALTDTLDSHLILVAAPGMSGTTTLTASGILTGGAQLNFQITVHSTQPLNTSVSNIAHLSGDGSLRDLIAPLVAVGNRLLLPIVQR